MSVPVSELKGMSPEMAQKLIAMGIKNNEQFLEAAKAPENRKQLAQQLGCETRPVLELANRADLSRVKGVAGTYSDLLEQAGVDTVKELATRRADNLHAKILEVNAERKITSRPPTADMVTAWVAQAKELPKILAY